MWCDSYLCEQCLIDVATPLICSYSAIYVVLLVFKKVTNSIFWVLNILSLISFILFVFYLLYDYAYPDQVLHSPYEFDFTTRKSSLLSSFYGSLGDWIANACNSLDFL